MRIIDDDFTDQGRTLLEQVFGGNHLVEQLYNQLMADANYTQNIFKFIWANNNSLGIAMKSHLEKDFSPIGREL